MRDSTLNGWLDSGVLRGSMSRPLPSDSFKLAVADIILLATSLWTRDLHNHSDVSCKKLEAFDALKYAATTELSANQSAAKLRLGLRCLQQHTATVKLLANENAAELGNYFDWLIECCKKVSVIMIDKMTATDFEKDSAILVSKAMDK